MDNLFMILLLVSMLALPVFVIISVIAFIKKDGIKGKKMLKFSGISFAAVIVAAIGLGATTDPAETTEKETVETVAKSHNDKPATVTPDEFKKLEKGMSLDKVEEIVGGKSKNPDAKENDNLILILEYDGENGIEKDSIVSLIFKDGKLDTIQQLGLIMEKETDEEKAAREAKEAEEKVVTEQKVKNEKAINVPKYKIEEDNFGKGMWRVTLSTPSTDEKELKALVEETKKLAKDKYKDVSSIWVNVKTENSVANTYAAMAKVALDDKGKAATGLNEIGVFEFKYNVDETHKTTKADLKQSTASYSAEDILKAFQDAGLPTTDSRDNSHNCISLECTTLITTEDVSIYEWPSVEKAQEVRAKKFGDAQVGTIIIRMNNKSLDIQPYIDVLNSIIN